MTHHGSQDPSKLKLRRNDRRYRKARRTQKVSDWTACCKLRQHTQQLMRSAHNSYIRDVIGASLLEGGNQKRFWSYVKRNKTENMSVPILSDREGLHITDQAKSEALNRPGDCRCTGLCFPTILRGRSHTQRLVYSKDIGHLQEGK